MKTSIITSTVTRKTTMLRMLDCLARQTQLPDEIIIIEAGEGTWGPEDFPEILRTRYQVHYAPKESLSASRDRGRKLATGDVLFFLDDDLILPDAYIATATEYLRDHPQIMGVGGRYVDESITGRRTWTLAIGRVLGIYGDGSRNRILPSGWIDYVRGDAATQITSAEWLFGCNSAIRRSAFDRAHMETQMAAWSFLEDAFFGTSLTAAYGDCLRLLPAMEVIHAPMASSGRLSPITLRMRILYRYIFWRERLRGQRPVGFWLGMLANLLLMLRLECKFWVVPECLRAYLFCVREPQMDWEKANGFVFAKH